MSELVAILDAGSQYGKVIDRRVRELNVESVLLPLSTPVADIRSNKRIRAVIIGGGPASVYGDDAPAYDAALFECGVPVLGICYGMQLMNVVHGGSVEKRAVREDGQFDIDIDVAHESQLFAGLGARTRVLLTHGDSVTNVAGEFVCTARSHEGLVAAIECPVRQLYGVQFHPEVDLSVRGVDMLRNFLFGIARLSGSFTGASRQELAVQYIHKVVGGAGATTKVLVLVSGGVDSTVCAALLKSALPAERIIALHIDNGFMRQDESADVARALRAIGVDLQCVDATQTFAEARTRLKGADDDSERLCDSVRPEVKRQIIGDTFVHVANRAIADLGLRADDVFLAQGTLRPDLIESANEAVSSNAAVIKTHHNDTELVRVLRRAGRIIEPLADYHKDEVRALGEALGLPRALVWRQPFPGPGLAVRLLCAEQPYVPVDVDRIQAALATFAAAHAQFDFTLLPVRSVGVQGDGRTYSAAVALSCGRRARRVRRSDDASTDADIDVDVDVDSVVADATTTVDELRRVDWRAAAALAKQLPKSVHGVNRVVFAFGARLGACVPLTITESHLRAAELAQLRAADAIVNRVLAENDLVQRLSQVPVISVPASLGVDGTRCVCVRPFLTHDFMTGVPAIPGDADTTSPEAATATAEGVFVSASSLDFAFPLAPLAELVNGVVTRVAGVVRVLYDLTPKPPGTTEWE